LIDVQCSPTSVRIELGLAQVQRDSLQSGSEDKNAEETWIIPGHYEYHAKTNKIIIFQGVPCNRNKCKMILEFYRSLKKSATERLFAGEDAGVTQGAHMLD
jgi:hypothetical protein